MNKAYLSVNWLPYQDKNTIPADIDLLLLGLNAADKLVSNELIANSLNPVRNQGISYTITSQDDSRLFNSHQNVLIDFNQLPNDVQKVAVFVYSHKIQFGNSGTVRLTLNKVRDLMVSIDLPDKKYLTRLSDLYLVDGKYCCLYGILEKGLNNQWFFTPHIDVDMPQDLQPLIKKYI